MNIKRTKEEIKNTIEAYLKRDAYGAYEIPSIRQRPVLLLGPPGVGKTQIMEQIARECQIGLVAYTITHHTRQSAIGLPFISKKQYGGREYAVTEYTMSEIVASIYEKMEQTGLTEGILFIDEINCVSETLAPAMLQFLQCKSFGNHKIPEGWVIVAAGNPPEYNKSVREFDVVTMDRVKKIEVEADFLVWKEYAYQQGLHGAVISYLNARKQNFYQMETTVDGRNFATPRGWEDLSEFLTMYEKLGKTADREVVAQYIQFPKIAKDFANYLELYGKYQTDYQLEEIFQGRLDEILLKKIAHASFDERLSVLGLILSRVNEELKRAVQWEEYMEMLQPCLLEFKELAGAGQPETALPETEAQGLGRHEAGGEETEAALPETEAQGLGRHTAAGEEAEAGWAETNSGNLNGYQLFSTVCRKLNIEYTNKKNAELLSREDEKQYLRAISALERFQQALKLELLAGPEQAFLRVKELFGQENEKFAQQQETASLTLEYAFDFLEGAFGTGQEMVMFITELNSNYYSVKFLQGCGCQRYYQYNKELLFDEKRRKLLERLE